MKRFESHPNVHPSEERLIIGSNLTPAEAPGIITSARPEVDKSESDRKIAELIASIKKSPEVAPEAVTVKAEPAPESPMVTAKERVSYGASALLYRHLAEPLTRNTYGKLAVWNNQRLVKKFEKKSAKVDGQIDRLRKDLAFIEEKIALEPKKGSARLPSLKEKKWILESRLEAQKVTLDSFESKRQRFHQELTAITSEMTARLEARLMPYTEEIDRFRSVDNRLAKQQELYLAKVATSKSKLKQLQADKKNASWLMKPEYQAELKKLKAGIKKAEKRLKYLARVRQEAGDKIELAKLDVEPYEEQLKNFKEKANLSSQRAKYSESGSTRIEKRGDRFYPEKYLALWNEVAKRKNKFKYEINYQRFKEKMALGNEPLLIAELEEKMRAYLLRQKLGEVSWQDIMDKVQEKLIQ